VLLGKEGISSFLPKELAQEMAPLWPAS
jgi:hypothetical protein